MSSSRGCRSRRVGWFRLPRMRREGVAESGITLIAKRPTVLEGVRTVSYRSSPSWSGCFSKANAGGTVPTLLLRKFARPKRVRGQCKYRWLTGGTHRAQGVLPLQLSGGQTETAQVDWKFQWVRSEPLLILDLGRYQ